MNIYDFDGTIYSGDSTIDFFLFLLKRHPAILFCVPHFLLAAVKHKAGRCTTTEMKEAFFSFLPKIPDISGEVEQFWQKNIRKIYPWYLAQKCETDIIISASPEFLLKTACAMLGISTLIASEVDEKTGRFLSENCKGQEKVRRFEAQCGQAAPEKFYSDSLSDLPMAQLAGKAFLVKRGTVCNWEITEKR